jgi:hypothetical protein
MKGLVSLFGFEEKVGDTKLYYKGPTLDTLDFLHLVMFCVAIIGLSLGFGSKTIMWFALLLILIVWTVVDWYFARRALRVMREVVIEAKEVNLSEVKIYTDGEIIGWEYKEFSGVIKKVK